MLEPADTRQSDVNASANVEALLTSDYELNGTVNRAASEGAKFGLILAMLEQNSIHRPQIENVPELAQYSELERDLNHYRPNPLSANDTYWQICQHTGQLIHDAQLHSAQLWLAMHPEPLALCNNPLAIDEDIIANCSLYAQARMQQENENIIKVDETGLYDILQDLEHVEA